MSDQRDSDELIGELDAYWKGPEVGTAGMLYLVVHTLLAILRLLERKLEP